MSIPVPSITGALTGDSQQMVYESLKRLATLATSADDVASIITASLTATTVGAAIAQPAGQILYGTGTNISSDAYLAWDSTNRKLKLSDARATSYFYTAVDVANAAADALYIEPPLYGGGRMYLGPATGGTKVYALNFHGIGNIEDFPPSLWAVGTYDGWLFDATRTGFKIGVLYSGQDIILYPGSGASPGWITGPQTTALTFRDIRFKSWAQAADGNSPVAAYTFDTQTADTGFAHTVWKAGGNEVARITQAKWLGVGRSASPGGIAVWGDHATVPWKLYSYSASFGGVRNDILSIGFNVWNQDDLSKAGIALQMENDYYSGGVHSSEFIFAWNDTDGTGRRPWQTNITYGTRAVQHLLEGNVRIYNSAHTGNPAFDFLDGGFLVIQSPGGVTALNDYAFLKQQNSSGVDTTLLYLTGGNRLDIAPTGLNTSIGGSLFIGGADSPASLLDVGGSVAPSIGYAGVRFRPTISPTGATDVYSIYNAPTINIPASAATSSVQGFRCDIPTISLGGGASLDYATNLYVQGAPTIGTYKWAFYVDGSSANSGVAGLLGVGVAANAAPAARLQVKGGANAVQFIVNANGTQTANIAEIRNSGTTVLASFDPSGYLGIGTGGAAQTAKLLVGTSATSGTSVQAENNDGTYAACRVANAHASGWGVYDTSPKAYVTKLLVGDGAAATPSYAFSNSTGTGLYYYGSHYIGVVSNGTAYYALGADEFYMKSSVGIGWSSGAMGAAKDLGLIRSAAGILKVTDGSTGTGILSCGDVYPRGVTLVWPAANAAGVLTNNGTGTLSWAASGTGGISVITPTGTIDGSNKTFTLPSTPPTDYIVYIDGQVCVYTTDYTVSSTTLTVAAGRAAPTQWIRVIYSTGSTVLTTKGDLFGYSSAAARVPVGADGKVLTADSGASLGVSYKGSWVQIAQVVTTSSQSSVDFSSIPSGFVDLMVVWQARSNVSATYETMGVVMNNDTTTGNYNYTQSVQGNSSSVSAFSSAPYSGGVAYIFGVTGSTSLSSEAATGRTMFPAYSKTTFYKRFNGEAGGIIGSSGSTSYYTAVYSGTWKSTSAINRLTFNVPTSFVDGSVFTLYGLGA